MIASIWTIAGMGGQFFAVGVILPLSSVSYPEMLQVAIELLKCLLKHGQKTSVIWCYIQLAVCLRVVVYGLMKVQRGTSMIYGTNSAVILSIIKSFRVVVFVANCRSFSRAPLKVQLANLNTQQFLKQLFKSMSEVGS